MGTIHADFSDSEFNKHQNYVEILQGMRRKAFSIMSRSPVFYLSHDPIR